MRVLNVADTSSPYVGICGTALLADSILADRAGQTGLLLLDGDDQGERLLEELGIMTRDRIGCTGMRAVFPFRRYVRHVGGFDLLHVWSPASLTTAILAMAGGGPNTPVILTLMMGPTSVQESHWLSVLLHRGRAQALAISNSVKKAWVETGVPMDRIHVLRPGLDMGRIAHHRRAELRRSWGADDDRMTVIGFVGEPVERMDAARAAHLAALAGLTGVKVRLLVPPGVARLEAGMRLSEAMLGAEVMVVDDRMTRIWETVAGLDVALMLGDDTREPPTNGCSKWAMVRARPWRSTARWQEAWQRQINAQVAMPGVLPLMYAAAAGKIIVAEASYAVSEVIEHRHSGLLVKPGDDHELALKIRQAVEDRQLAWKVRDAARSEAFSFFSKSRYQSDLRVVQQQIVRGERVEVPPMPVTGGLRFAGIG